MKIAAIDFGEVHIGLALSDLRATLASPLTTLRAAKTLPETAQLIASQLKGHSLKALVIGLPLHLNGKESPLSLKARELAELLKTLLEIPLILWDERLSTAQTDRTLKEMGFSRRERAKRIDSAAAATILQSYLDSLGYTLP